MSRHLPDGEPTSILNAVSHWRDNCLIEDGSVFSDEALWTAENLDILDRAFNQNPQEGSESFAEKLRYQLSNVPSAAARLMAELNWLLLLFPRNINPNTKRQQIIDIWELTETSLAKDHRYLSDEVLAGVGHAGTAYNTYRWRELSYLINIARAMKGLPVDERRRVLSDPWVFAEWLAEIPRDGFRQLRHMLSWMLFPDTFESITTGRDKRSILQHLEGIPSHRLRSLEFVEVDRRLLDLRRRLEEESGETVQFYESPWVERWNPPEKSWLLLWNPRHYSWEGFSDDRLRIAKGESVTRRWSTASSQLGEGDTVYLMRVGENPKGLVAQGNVARAPYKDTHWDEERAERDEQTRFVDITLTDLRDPEVDRYISLSELESEASDRQQWTPQQSGIEVKTEAAKRVQELWAALPHVTVGEEPPHSARQEAIAIDRPTNEILYGPPGTGKTYYLERSLMPHYETRASRVSEEEWLFEQLVDTTWWEAVALALADRGGQATVSELIEHPYFKAKARLQGQADNPNLRAYCWSSLQIHAVQESETVNYALDRRRPPLIFDKTPDGQWFFTGDWEEAGAGLREQLTVLRQGPAADGTYVRRYQMVSFHQSYSYEDFIEGIRPQATEGGISYEVCDGVFKKWCNRARQDPNNRYAFFIDEVNRGNVARIFGELITLIEGDKRAWWDSEGQLVEGIESILPYSGDRFGVPKNLDIYATMNTADRSIALMDAALRRRFRFRELMPKPQAIAGHRDGLISDGEGGQLDLRRLLEVLNLRLRYLLHRDQTFGHAYFTNVRDLDGLREVLVYDIIPMLAEYFYDDWGQIQRVLGDDAVSAEYQIVTMTMLAPALLFGSGYEQPEKPDYQVRAPGEITADAIRKVYESLGSPDE